MIRKLLLPAVAIALLGGCMTSGYSYRQDRGDYYYGQPGVDYRYHDSPYGYPSYRYGYPGYPGYPYGYGGYYGHWYPYQPYPGGYPYYRHPYRPRPPVVVVPRPDDGTPPEDPDHDQRRPPWRNLDNLGRGRQSEPQHSPPLPVALMPPPARPAVRPPEEGGSRNRQVIRRSRQEARDRETE